MSKYPRELADNAFYHVILRGINHNSIFKDEADFKKFLYFLEFYSKENHTTLYAYVLMTNHIHLLLKDQNRSLSRFAKQTASSYATYFNKRHARSGNLFQGRFKSEMIKTNSYLLTALRYIHQNPIKAGITNTLENYPWSSYKDYFSTSSLINKKFFLDFFDSSLKKFAIFNNEATSYFKSKIDSPKYSLSDRKISIKIMEVFDIKPQDFRYISDEHKVKIIKWLLNQDISWKQIARTLSISTMYISRIINIDKK